MPVRLPIRFLHDDLTPAAKPCEGRPLVQVRLTGQTPSVGVDFRVSEEWALIDTGADHNYGEVRLLERLGCPKLSTATVTGATSSMVSWKRSIVVVIGDSKAGVGVTTDIYDLDSLHDRGKPYHLVLGNLFLQQGILHMDYVRGNFWFDYYTEAERGGLVIGMSAP